MRGVLSTPTIYYEETKAQIIKSEASSSKLAPQHNWLSITDTGTALNPVLLHTPTKAQAWWLLKIKRNELRCKLFLLFCSNTNYIHDCKMHADFSLAASQQSVLQQWTPVVSFPNTIWSPRSPDGGLGAYTCDSPYTLDGRLL